MAPDLPGQRIGRGRSPDRRVVRRPGVSVTGRTQAGPDRRGAGHRERADAGLPADRGPSFGWPAWSFRLMAGSLAALAAPVAWQRQRTRTAGVAADRAQPVPRPAVL